MKSGDRGFTLTEIVVTIFIVTILMSLMGVSMSNFKNRSSSMKCMANLRAMGIALHAYASDHGDMTPDSSQSEFNDIRSVLSDLDPRIANFTCPLIPKNISTHYTPYLYLIPGEDLSLASFDVPIMSDVLLAHRPKNGGKGGVQLYADNHCDFYKLPGF